MYGFWEIGRLVSDDRISLEYLWKNHENVLCTFCNSRDFYFLGRWRYDVNGVGEIYYPLKGTRFSLLRITPSQWLSLINLFQLCITQETAKDISLRYKTALKALPP